MKNDTPRYSNQQEWKEVEDLRAQVIDETHNTFSERNTEKLREIERIIASAIIISKDGKILMGKKDPAQGGVYPDAWHIPGGGLNTGESLLGGMLREVGEEVEAKTTDGVWRGFDLSGDNIIKLEDVGYDETPKTKEGERVWCKMHFHRFEVRLDKTAAELELRPGADSDLVELRWFSREELRNVKQAGGGQELFRKAGYMG